MAGAELTKRVVEIKTLLSDLKSELEEKFDNSSERWKESDAGDACLSDIDAFERAIEALDDISA